MTNAGVVIVTHNSAEVIENCLDALGNLPCIVVDNASSDDSVALASGRRGVTVIPNGENRGFAAAVNQGVALLDCELVLILNPDTVLLTGLEPLAEACKRAGLAGGRLVDFAKRTQRGFTIRRFPTPWALAFETLGINRLWPGNPVNRRYRYLDRDLSAPGPAEQPAGAFLMVRRDVWERVGGFDERFFPVWFEDVDFCLRAYQSGFSAYYVPEVMACHRGGHSVGQIPGSRAALLWYVSLLRYAFKHFRMVRARGVGIAVLLSAMPRAAIRAILERSLQPIWVHWKVVQLVCRCLFTGRAQQYGVAGADSQPRLSPLIGGR